MVLMIFAGMWVATSGKYLPVFTKNNKQTQRDHIQKWTCSMHPQIQKNKPGQCPICNMNLIPVASSHDHGDSEKEYDEETTKKGVFLSKEAVAMAEVELEEVKRDFVSETISLTGRLTLDETRVETISARVSGRVEKLFIDYPGIQIKKGDHMALLYSPELLIAQQELLEALKVNERTLIQSSRKKLSLWGLSKKQISDIEKRKKALDTLTINSPSQGTILKKYINEGDYILTGTKMYSIANLSRLWLLMEAYESDVAKLHYGQEIAFETAAYPGEIFKAMITFIDPVVDPNTRTIRVRAVYENKAQKLKPDMLAKAIVKVSYGEKHTQKIINKKARYICPMHPEEFSSAPGACAICGMALEPADKLRFAQKGPRSGPPLIIPDTAPLLTGKRSIVYVSNPNRPGFYMPKQVVLGPKVGDYYIVKSGLEEGEFVVKKGGFKIDSAMQLQAKPSMMQDGGKSSTGGHRH